ncbi:MAG: ferritin-like domain-containing protein [Pseudomonadota bacterium]|nr:ferritin-like domain-containing protein [Pseudomonadota bacterium]
MPTQSSLTQTPAQLGDRLIKLTAKGTKRGHVEEDAFSWARTPRRPFWLPLQGYAGIVADLHYGELATAKACGHTAAILPEPEAKACLAVQRDDEQFHARLYARYLARLGTEGTVTSGVRDAYERCLSWPGDPLGLVLAFNVVLEGEAMRLQRYFATRFPCPLFAELNRRILADEARHIAFGRIYGRPGLQRLDTEERIALYRWLKAIWWDCAVAVRGRFDGVGGWILRALHPPLEQSWRRQTDSLLDLGLIRPEELARLERNGGPG